DARIFELTSYIQRRQPGRYEEATRNLEHAISLDPRNVLMLSQIAAYNYRRLHRYADAETAWNRLIAIEPDNVGAKIGRASVAMDWKADPQPLHQIIDSIRVISPDSLPRIADTWLLCALAERDAPGAEKALSLGAKDIDLGGDALLWNRSLI